MPRTIGIGIQNFDELVSQQYFYVDKTDFIRKWWENGDMERGSIPHHARE
ncbi:MAG: AAA family ATPase [Lachnospiraceae bacterium]|nr:AAA family ATPase [Lachnospiraceae bacterium]